MRDSAEIVATAIHGLASLVSISLFIGLIGVVSALASGA